MEWYPEVILTEKPATDWYEQLRKYKRERQVEIIGHDGSITSPFGAPCDQCGREVTEYRDLGTKGFYKCWWCTEREAIKSPENLDEEPLTRVNIPEMGLTSE